MKLCLQPHHHPLLLLLLLLPTIIYANTSFGTRHSYSLTTFDPSGNLDQVVRALRASTLGVPIVALCLSECVDESKDESSAPNTTLESVPASGGVYMSIPLRFISTSPLLFDDGTPRIIPLSSNICLLHTGVGADGRALSDIAIQSALDYKYLYGVEMGVQDLLAELSSKMQQMTMKAGSRPYGCALLICALGEGGRNAMYRVDPSGAVVLLSSMDDVDSSSIENEIESTIKSRRRSVALMGNWEATKQKKDLIQQQLEKQKINSEEQIQKLLVDAARQTCTDGSDANEEASSKTTPVLFASFNRERGLEIKRITT